VDELPARGAAAAAGRVGQAGRVVLAEHPVAGARKGSDARDAVGTGKYRGGGARRSRDCSGRGWAGGLVAEETGP
jgi:hypothetical protein